MSNWDTYKTTNLSYWPLVHSVPYSTNVPSWDLHQTPGNPWDDLIAAIQAWVDNVNANGKNLSNVAKLTGNGGLLGVGNATPVRALHVNGITSGGGVAVTGVAPQVQLSNADTEPNTNTATCGLALATVASNYGLPNAGDSMLFNLGTSHGDIYINANYTGAGGTKNVILQPSIGSVGIGTSTPAAASKLHIHLATNQNVLWQIASGVVSLAINNDANSANVALAIYALSYALPGLPSVAPAAGSKQLWYDPADSNRVKFAP